MPILFSRFKKKWILLETGRKKANLPQLMIQSFGLFYYIIIYLQVNQKYIYKTKALERHGSSMQLCLHLNTLFVFIFVFVLFVLSALFLRGSLAAVHAQAITAEEGGCL